MTDTRKDFEEWARLFMDKNERAPFSNEIWQACQSLNDKRIEQLLAVIAKKDEALIKACELIEKFSLQVYNGSDCLMVYESVELQPADVELVEVGKVKEERLADWMPNTELSVEYNYDGFNAGDKLYTIKQKG